MASLVSVYRGVLLYGDSGSGKSSLANAGLIPEAIRLGFAPERLRVQPRASEEFVVERIASAGDGEKLLPSVLAPDEESAARPVLAMGDFEDHVRAACDRYRPLLIFDQFEEIVTLFDEAGARDAQRRLVKLLVQILRGSLPVKVLFSFREDYLGKLKELLSECPELVDQALRITPPTADALPTIIAGPFERYPDHFARQLSPELTDRLVTVLAERFGVGGISLSEVQTVCLRLWQSDNPEALLAEKGPQGLLEDYLGEALDGMPPQLRPTAIALLAQMVTSVGTRNVISAGDLFQRVQEQEGDVTLSLLDQALAGLSQSRLVRRERRRDLDLYEITSEYLVPWISRRRDEFRQLHHRRRERRRLLVLGSIAAALLLVAAAVTVLALSAIHSRQEAIYQRDVAISDQLISKSEFLGDTNPIIAKLLSIAAWRISPSAEARYAMRTAAALPGIAVLASRTGSVNSVAFSPDGKTLVIGGDGGARLWDLATRKTIGGPLMGHISVVNSVAFEPDGKTLAISAAKGTVYLCDAATRHPIGEPLIGSISGVTSVAFSPNGKTLAVGGRARHGSATVQLWDVATRQPMGKPFTSATAGFISVAFSPDGKTLASGSAPLGDGSGTVQLWDVATHQPIGKPFTSATAGLISVAFSPDGKILALGSGDHHGSGVVRLWDVATRQPIGKPLIGPTGSFASVAFSPDGKTLAAGGYDGTVWSWDMTTGQQIGSPLAGQTGPVYSVAFSPDGKTLASGSADGTVRLWDLQIGQQIGAPHAGQAHRVQAAFSPDGKTLAIGGNGTVRLWNAATRKPIGDPLPGLTGRVESLAFTRDGKFLAAGSRNGTIRLWNVATRKLIGGRLPGLTGDVWSVAFRPDGKILATGGISGQHGTFRYWNAATGQPIGPQYRYGIGVYSMAYSPDGKTLAISTYRALALVRARHSGFIHTPDLADYSVAFSPNGKILATGGIDDTVRLWDVATRQQIGGPLTGDSGPVLSVAFSPDGKTLASGSFDGTVRLWDVATGQQIGSSLTGDGRVLSVAFSPDGKTLASGSADGTVRLWNTSYLTMPPASYLCTSVAQSLTREEWARYIPLGPAYQRICP